MKTLKVSAFSSPLLLVSLLLTVLSGNAHAQTETADGTDLDFFQHHDFNLSELDLDTVVSEESNPLKVSVVLSDIYSKKDMEFVRGFLMGIQQAELAPKSLALKVINGEVSADSINHELERFGADIIFATHDREIPRSLTDFAMLNSIKLFNVFDTKSEEFKTDSVVNELLPPSLTFNNNIASKLASEFGENDLLLILDDPDPQDVILQSLMLLLPENNIRQIPLTDFATYQPEADLKYFVYPASSDMKTVPETLKSIHRLAYDHPEITVEVIGRPNWVMVKDLKSSASELDVLIPAKCYFNPADADSKKFISDYKAAYGHTPVVSYPVYSVMGYDVARYFLPVLVAEKFGLMYDAEPRTMLQSRFNMTAGGEDGGGRYNSGSFLLHLMPWGTIEKIPLN